ncbi:MAG: protein kinase [Gammaproteobacteria bacterium]|nr:protein kinase [Gammaproteobacteria bacterium]
MEDNNEERTRYKPVADEDVNSSSDATGTEEGNDEATQFMAPGEAPEADEATRYMGAKDATGADANETDGATRFMGRESEPGEALPTQVVPAELDSVAENGPAMVDVSAERDAGKTIINDRFVLEQLMGAGGMGSVYKAKDLRKVEARDRNPWVAVKLLNDDFKTHPGAFMSLQREARKSQALAHPNIVQVFDFDREGDTVYMTMELLEGNDLGHYIKNHPNGVEVEEALRLTREMGAALHHAHSHDITHADFKPANVFVSESGASKVLDFGIAQAVAHADVGATTDDKTAFDPGSLGALTPAYASLEMLEGKDPLPADDIYALGCIVYQLLSGRHPYDKMPADEALAKGKQPGKIEKLNRRQWRALQKALALKRVDRYQSVAEFQSDFAPWANPWRKRLGIAVGIALVLGGVGIYQAVSNYYGEEALTAEVRERETELVAESGRRQAVQEVKDSLDRSFSNLQAAVDRVKGLLAQHRFGFDPSSIWKQKMRDLLAELRQLYLAEDWIADLNTAEGLDESKLLVMRQQERERRSSAAGATELWIASYQKKIAQDYLKLASTLAKEGQFVDARAGIDDAARLDPDSPELLDANRELEALIAQNRRENEAIAQLARDAERERARQRLQANFKAADAAILADLKSCTKTLSRTGRGGSFSYSISGLADKAAALRSRYAALGAQANTAVATYVSELGACIQLYGYADPAAAKQQLATAKRSFPKYAQRLAGLPIHPWNTCKPSFAGKGDRYDCRDRFLGKNQKGPTLVVIPAGNGIEEFAIGKYEISVEEFDAWCTASGACQAAGGEGSLPATGRSLELVAGYIDWLSESTGFLYQLPTRQQWLYAADAGGTGLDPGRNCTLESRGIMKGQVMLPVEMGADNGWGLVHHVGNARELVKDSGGLVAAGGSRTDPMDDCTVQAVAPVDANGDSYTGFRVIRT